MDIDENKLNPEEVAKSETIFDFANEKVKEEKTEFGLVKTRSLEQEMQESYLDYAMSVIISRALPDVRDGLKPVHRRVLFSMYELGLLSRAKFRKSATVVGDVLGKYHPHGDVAVYDTLVRMAQDFSMREPLVQGQGNFGSVDGDQPAAMRYTECKMSAVSEETLVDIDKNTVDFVPNYDSTRKEPKVLPTKVPNLLLNGALGIAVGMATNIPPHNLGELVDGTVALIDNPEIEVDELMHYIKGPDFPTGAEIYGTEQIKAAYATGRGSIVQRAVAAIEEQKRGGFRIIISQIPYQVNKAELIGKIADLVKDKKIDGISGLRDESDRTEGVRIVIDLKSSAYPKKILNRLFELTAMQTAFHVNMLALIDGIQPRVLTLKNALEEYIKHRQKVVRRRTEYDLAKAKERAHILEGLRIALANIDEVVSVIKKSQNREAAQESLIKKFKLDEIQANAILEMRLSSLAALEVKKVEDEYQEKLRFIKDCETILGDEKKILAIIKKELADVKKRFETPRKTKIYEQAVGRFSAEDLIPSEQVIVMLTKGNYIKRMPVTAYRSQVRGGRGVVGIETKEEDTVEHLIAANTHDDILFFTDRGKAYQTKVYDIPATSRIAKGQAIVNILQTSPEEKVTAVVTLESKRDGLQYFVFATTKGIVKKTDISMYKSVRKTGIQAIKLSANDKLKWVKTTSGADKIFMSSAKGQAILYHEKDIRPMGRSAAGVRGILLKGDDECVGIDVVPPSLEEKAAALVVLENGFGKRTPLKYFNLQLRGGMGMRLANVTARTGRMIDMHVVYGDVADVILASKAGQMIRMDLHSIKFLNRDTQGVTLIRLNKSDKVASVTVVTKSAEEMVQKVEGEEAVVQVPTKEDRPVQEVPKLKETDTKEEIEKEVEEIKDGNAEIPEWAKVHEDLHVKEHLDELGIKKGNAKTQNEDKTQKGQHGDPEEIETQKEEIKQPGTSAKTESEEPNWWGGKMS